MIYMLKEDHPFKFSAQRRISRAILARVILGLLVAICVTSPQWNLHASTPATEHGQAARQYLDKLSKGDIDLSKDVALSPHCGSERKRQIKDQLKFLTQTHFHQGDHLSFVQQNQLGQFAAVLFKAENPRTPLSTRVHAVALIQRDQKWQPAPLPGSFANTGYGYEESIEKVVRTLEQWMLKEKNSLESQARKKAESDLLGNIRKEEAKAKLSTLSQQEAVTNLLQQFRATNMLGILAATGAASHTYSGTLEAKVNTISTGLSSTEPDTDWQLVTNPSVISQILHYDKTKQEVIVGFWNPLSSQNAHIIHFKTSKNDKTGKRYVRLPSGLKIEPDQGRLGRRALRNRGRRDQQDLMKKIPATIFKALPAEEFPQDNKQLISQFKNALNSQDFSQCIPLLPRKGKFFSPPATKDKTLTLISNLWRRLYQLQSNTREEFDLIEDNNLALLPLTFSKINRPGDFKTVKVWFFKHPESGWHLIPEELLREFADKEMDRSISKLISQARSAEKAQREKYSKSIMANVLSLSPPLKLPPVDPDLAELTLTQFRTFLRAKDPASALGQCAVLKGTSNTQTLKTFNYALRGASDHRETDHFLGSKQAGKWLGISVRTESRSTGEYDYPLYLIVNTTKGARVLLDIDLRHATNKGRKLLNKRNMGKLQRVTSPAELDGIRKIFDHHQQLAETDIKASEPIND